MTARLHLERPQERHRGDFIAFYGDPAVMSIRKFGALDPARAGALFEQVMAHWDEHGFGLYAVAEGRDGRFAGECGLRWLVDGSEVELSYGLLPEFRGRGLATEAARAVLDTGRDGLGLSAVVALSRGDNRASHQVLEKLGMSLLWRREDTAHGLVKYRLTLE